MAILLCAGPAVAALQDDAPMQPMWYSIRENHDAPQRFLDARFCTLIHRGAGPAHVSG